MKKMRSIVEKSSKGKCHSVIVSFVAPGSESVAGRDLGSTHASRKCLMSKLNIDALVLHLNFNLSYLDLLGLM